MTQKIILCFSKSSCLWPLLLLFILTALTEQCVAAMPNDTIILGGKRLLIQRELSYDTLPEKRDPEILPEKRNTVKRRKFDTWRVGFEVTPAVFVHRFESEDPALITLDEAGIGKSNPGSGMGLAVAIERKIATRSGAFWLTFTPGIDYFSAPSPYFDPELLSDSLFGFHYYGDGRLGEITRFRYPIGAEFDTLEVRLSQNEFRTAWLSLPVGLLYEIAVNKQLALRFGGGINLRILMSGDQPDLMLLPKTGIDYIQLLESQNEWAYRSLIVTPWLQGSMRYALDRNWGLNLGLRAAFPFNEVEQNTWINRRGLSISALIGLSYALGK